MSKYLYIIDREIQNVSELSDQIVRIDRVVNYDQYNEGKLPEEIVGIQLNRVCVENLEQLLSLNKELFRFNKNLEKGVNIYDSVLGLYVDYNKYFRMLLKTCGISELVFTPISGYHEYKSKDWYNVLSRNKGDLMNFISLMRDQQDVGISGYMKEASSFNSDSFTSLCGKDDGGEFTVNERIKYHYLQNMILKIYFEPTNLAFIKSIRNKLIQINKSKCFEDKINFEIFKYNYKKKDFEIVGMHHSELTEMLVEDSVYDDTYKRFFKVDFIDTGGEEIDEDGRINFHPPYWFVEQIKKLEFVYLPDKYDREEFIFALDVFKIEDPIKEQLIQYAEDNDVFVEEEPLYEDSYIIEDEENMDEDILDDDVDESEDDELEDESEDEEDE